MLPNCDNSAAIQPLKRSIPSRSTRLYYEGKRDCEGKRVRSLAAAPVDLNVEIPDLLPQRIAVEAEQVGRADLVATRGRQRRGEQRHLDLLEDAVVEPRRWHAVREAGEVRGQIGFDRAAEVLHAHRGVAARGDCRWRQFAVDDRGC